jgi:TatD DNase family protein
MIDSHAHLTDPRLLDQIDAVVGRALDGGVARIVTIAVDLEDAPGARALAEKYDCVYFACGIHPHYCLKYEPSDVGRLREYLGHPKCVALGEIGLEYHWQDVPREHQKRMLPPQLELAREMGKAVVIHSRLAIGDTLEIMSAGEKVEAVFHCFTGTLEEARRVLGAGYHLGFTGPVTFKKNEGLREIVGATPLGRLLIETDCPYMTPEPFRNVKVNEPRYVRHVLETVAREHGVSVEEADRVTTETTRRLYGMRR